MAARKKRATKKKKATKKKPKAKIKVKFVDAEFEPDEAEPEETLGSKLKKKLGGYADKLIETAETDPDKLVAGATQLLNNTERLVQAVKKDPDGAKVAMRNGIITLFARLAKASRSSG